MHDRTRSAPPLLIALLGTLFAGTALAVTPTAAATNAAKSPIADIAFLAGTWDSGTGAVTETGQTSRGSSTMTLETGGAALLRRDHTELFDANGKPAGSFEQLMLVYGDRGALHADYVDGTHVIHYASAVVVLGRSVVFKTAATPDAPTYRLTYELPAPDTLTVRFEVAPPGRSEFHPIATGSLTRAKAGA